MTITFASRLGRILPVALASALIVVASLGIAIDPAKARGGRSYYRPSKGGTHAHYAGEYGYTSRSHGSRIFSRSTRGFGDEHFGAVGRRFRRGPNGVPYLVGFGAIADRDTTEGVETEIVAQPACVHDRVPEPPPGLTYFSRPLRPFEITDQPVFFSDKVPDRAGGFQLCE